MARRLLRSCVITTLELANKNDIQSISMPAVSSGIFGFPVEDCAQILIETTLKWAHLTENPTVKSVRMCNIDMKTVNVF